MKKRRKRLRVYWETSVLLAWLKDERREPGQMENLYAVAESILDNSVIMFTSATTFSEIFETSLVESQRNRLAGVFNRTNADVVNVDVPVGKVAAEIRRFYKALSRVDGRPPLCYADAEHLAAAIVYKADEFHTFDRDAEAECRSLLELGDEVAGYPLKVRMPTAVQLGML